MSPEPSPEPKERRRATRPMDLPEGEERIVTPAEIVMTPLGARELNEQRELINKTVNSEAEEVEDEITTSLEAYEVKG